MVWCCKCSSSRRVSLSACKVEQAVWIDDFFQIKPVGWRCLIGGPDAGMVQQVLYSLRPGLTFADIEQQRDRPTDLLRKERRRLDVKANCGCVSGHRRSLHSADRTAGLRERSAEAGEVVLS